MSDTLIPILGAVQRNRERRERDWKVIDDWPQVKYNTNGNYLNIGRMAAWIDEYTTGRFYLDLYLLAFEDEKDFTIFTLWYNNEH